MKQQRCVREKKTEAEPRVGRNRNRSANKREEETARVRRGTELRRGRRGKTEANPRVREEAAGRGAIEREEKKLKQPRCVREKKGTAA